MKTDRELLELAAKAAGLEINRSRQVDRDALIDPSTASLWLKNGSTAWNPIKDDGDALRLAVKLKLSISIEERNAHEWSHIVWVAPCFEPMQVDPCAATRRAIVRAAAAIGEAMP